MSKKTSKVSAIYRLDFVDIEGTEYVIDISEDEADKIAFDLSERLPGWDYE